MIWVEKTLDELSSRELFAALRLRSEVFVVEQDCVYLDLDDKDAQSIHLFNYDPKHHKSEAVVRLVPPSISYAEPSIGRVATSIERRGSGLGQELMERAIRSCQRHWPGQSIRISAQQYLIHFYEGLGFEVEGDGYLEDGIPHIEMLRPHVGLSAWENHWDEATNAFFSVLDALPEDKMNGSSSVWGGLQILEHLVISERSLLTYLSKKSLAIPEELPLTNLETDGNGWMLIQALRSKKRWKDPTDNQSLTPSDEFNSDKDLLKKQWMDFRAQSFEALGEILKNPTWWSVQVFPHPVAGRISLADVFGFGQAHILHHIHQLHRLMEPQE
ncbi:MAG: GNAT family N-acetyltransferase [Flavobacteriales bacterium]